MEIRTISHPELPGAMDLVWEVFQQYEAPDYPQEGIDEFKKFIDGQLVEMTIEMFGAFDKTDLLGIIATRNEGSHIALLFVKSELHGRGIGRKLFEHILPLTSGSCITVNSSPYATDIYRKLGFSVTDTEQVTNGIRYIPMRYLCTPNVTGYAPNV